jgi:2-keto-4-pentenoate hydratase/2-oxohepta-3-ene-1,7-dioic acid hydratase in catechol pathway
MKAVRYRVGAEGAPRIGRLEGDTIVDAGGSDVRGFIPSIENWGALESARGEAFAVADVTLLHPTVPEKIVAIGLNYRDHAEESKLELPDVPVVFAKFPSALIGPDAAIVIPREETRPDWEGEVAVVIGRRTYRADELVARDAVGGISIMHDVSGRRAQLETPLRQFTLGKSFDTFAPFGPCVASADGFEFDDIAITTTVDGETVQSSNTKHLIFSIIELIQYVSQGMTLEPGDVIATGTPAGVGDSRVPPRYLRDGEVVEITVGGVGTLRNPVEFER